MWWTSAFIDLALLQQVKEVERGRLKDYALRRGSSVSYVEGGSVWDVNATVALPCATQNELDGEAAARLVRNGVLAVAEGANMPSVSTSCAPRRPKPTARRGITWWGPISAVL
jgi:glutamate dehydrogenase (NADP+)